MHLYEYDTFAVHKQVDVANRVVHGNVREEKSQQHVYDMLERSYNLKCYIKRIWNLLSCMNSMSTIQRLGLFAIQISSDSHRI